MSIYRNLLLCFKAVASLCINYFHLQENEKSKDVIIEQRYHRLLIGPQGSRIKDLRERFQQVQIVFPDPSKKSDIVQVSYFVI